MDRIFVALDLEFTGLDAERDEIIEIGMVQFQGSEVLDTFSSLVRPRRALPLKIQQLSGISQEELDKAPTLRALMGQVLGFVKNYPIVGHSVDIDLRFLSRNGMPLGNLPIDTFELASILMPDAKRFSLANLCELLSIGEPQEHRALADAILAKDLFLALIERASKLEPDTLDEIVRLSASSDWSLRQLFRDIAQEQHTLATPMFGTRPARASRPIQPADPDEFEPLEPSKEIVPINVEQIAELIGPDGLFSRAFPGYEHRPQQVRNARSGRPEAFNDCQAIFIVEAGTGTGKSLAYLLRLVLFRSARMADG